RDAQKQRTPLASGVFVTLALGSVRRLSAAEGASALTGSLRTFLSFVHAQRTAIQVKAVQRLDGALRLVLRHVYKTEAARLSGFTVIDELDRIDLAVTLEEASDVLLCRVEGEIPHVDRRHPITRLQKR